VRVASDLLLLHTSIVFKNRVRGMYSWNTVRTICAVLLLIPIIHLAYLMSGEMLATLDGSPQAWAAEVEAYTEAAQSTQLPLEPVLVVGGRQVKLWRGLDNLLRPRAVLIVPRALPTSCWLMALVRQM